MIDEYLEYISEFSDNEIELLQRLDYRKYREFFRNNIKNKNLCLDFFSDEFQRVLCMKVNSYENTKYLNFGELEECPVEENKCITNEQFIKEKDIEYEISFFKDVSIQEFERELESGE